MANILFLSAGRRKSMGEIFRGWNNNNIFSYELDSECPIASIAEVIIAPKFETSLWRRDIDLLNESCENNEIDLIIPFSCQSAAWLYTYQTLLHSETLTCFGAKVCYDKECFSHWMTGSLEKYYPRPVINYPCILKPVGGCGSRGILNGGHWNGVCPDGWVAQKMLKGPEFSCDAYFDIAGNFVAGAVRHREVVSGGEVLDSTVVNRPDIINIVKEIGKSISFRGPICAQFMEDTDTSIKVIEINSRFGGGATLSIYAGLPFHEWVIDEYVKNKALPAEVYTASARIGAKTRRNFSDNFFG